MEQTARDVKVPSADHMKDDNQTGDQAHVPHIHNPQADDSATMQRVKEGNQDGYKWAEQPR